MTFNTKREVTLKLWLIYVHIIDTFDNKAGLLLFSVDLIWWLIYIRLNAHLAVYLIWRRDSTAKGAKKNTSPKVIPLQYSVPLIKRILVQKALILFLLACISAWNTVDSSWLFVGDSCSSISWFTLTQEFTYLLQSNKSFNIVMQQTSYTQNYVTSNQQNF